MNIQTIATDRQALREKKAAILAERKQIRNEKLKPLASQQADLEYEIRQHTDEIRRQIDKEQKQQLLVIAEQLKLVSWKRDRKKARKTTSRISIDYGRVSRNSDTPETVRQLASELHEKSRLLERMIKEITDGKRQLLISLTAAQLEDMHRWNMITVSLDLPQGIYL